MKESQAIQALKADFAELADPAEAAGMAAYMRHLFPFYGIKKPTRTVVYKEHFPVWKKRDRAEVIHDALQLWKAPQRELHYFAMEVLKTTKAWKDPEALPWLETLITTQSWWDSVDFIAVHLVGKFFEAHPQHIRPTTDRWIKSDHLWLQRTAIIFQLTYREKTDFDLLCQYILMHRDSKEFFIRKAMGWALRQYARTNAKAVMDFVEENTLPSLTVKEALKHLR